MGIQIYCIACKKKFSKSVYYQSHKDRKCQEKKIFLKPSSFLEESNNDLSMTNNEAEAGYSSDASSKNLFV